MKNGIVCIKTKPALLVLLHGSQAMILLRGLARSRPGVGRLHGVSARDY